MKAKFFISLMSFVTFFFAAHGQNCDSLVPKFYIDFTGSSAGTTWTSSYTVGSGYCCTASGFDRCIDFIITTDSNTAAVSFSIYPTTNTPLGVVHYQVDCGPLLVAGTDTQQITTCGTHCITTCKPGNRHVFCTITSRLASNPTNCTAYSQCNNIMSLVDLPSKPGISLFPNPFHYSTTLETNFAPCDLSIYNAWGQFVRKEFINNPVTIINRNSLALGIYFYKLISDSGHFATGRFIVE